MYINVYIYVPYYRSHLRVYSYLKNLIYRHALLSLLLSVMMFHDTILLCPLEEGNRESKLSV